jgi:hypothetical protein
MKFTWSIFTNSQLCIADYLTFTSVEWIAYIGLTCSTTRLIFNFPISKGLLHSSFGHDPIYLNLSFSSSEAYHWDIFTKLFIWTFASSSVLKAVKLQTGHSMVSEISIGTS